MRILVSILAAAVLGVVPASADMIEAQGNIYNGTVTSQDEKEVKFRDHKGVEHTFQRAQIGYLEFEKAPSHAEILLAKAKMKAQDAAVAAKGSSKVLSEGSKKAGTKAKSKMSKPLDRSAADKKGQMLGDAMGDYAKAAHQQAKKAKKAAKELRKNEIFEQKMRRGESITEEELDGKVSKGSKGKFRSL